MFKKLLSLAIVAMMLMSVAVIGVYAAPVDVADAAADADVADQGAETDTAATGADGTIYFDAASAGWESASAILFYISDLESGELAAWGSQKKLGGTKGDNNIWSFDAAGLGVTSGRSYIIIFNNKDTNAETYQLLMDASCFGDTAKANPSNMIENPVDSNKSSMEARWTNNSLGPRLQITSIGNVVGETPAPGTTKYDMFVQFLASGGKDGIKNALQFNGKDEQTTIDDTAAALGLTKADVKKAIEEAKTTGYNGETADWSDKWDASKSPLSEGDSGNSGDDDTSGGNSGGGNSGGNSGGSSKSGSASNTQTGQETTVLFVMLGVMVAAAGVIFFLRKKERA